MPIRLETVVFFTVVPLSPFSLAVRVRSSKIAERRREEEVVVATVVGRRRTRENRHSDSNGNTQGINAQ